MLFLHGFLGHPDDWAPFLDAFPSANAISLLEADLFQKAKKHRILIGYSAGGRIALELKARYPDAFDKVVVFSAHPGLHTEEEKRERLEIDAKWIAMLRNQPFDQFLEAWYSQELFNSLKESPHFKTLLKRRREQNPEQLAQFLEKYSLGKREAPPIFPGTTFIYGEKDLKYAKLYATLNPIKVCNAGHAVHLENPSECVQILKEVLHDDRRLLASTEYSVE